MIDARRIPDELGWPNGEADAALKTSHPQRPHSSQPFTTAVE
jgi:hypothetical protein